MEHEPKLSAARQEEKGQDGQIDQDGKCQCQGDEQTDVEGAFEAAEHERGKPSAQDDGCDDDGFSRGDKGPAQCPNGGDPLGQQQLVFGQEVEGVVYCNSKGNGEDDRSGNFEVDARSTHVTRNE